MPREVFRRSYYSRFIPNRKAHCLRSVELGIRKRGESNYPIKELLRSEYG